MKRASEQGAALLAVLAMVGLLAGFAAVGFANVRDAVDGRVAAGERAQARLVARGALALVAARRDPPVGGTAETLALPGGAAVLAVADGGNCLNLNGLGAPGGEGAQAFARLLAAVNAPGGQALADATASWAAGPLRVDVSEWAALPGVSAEAYALARPFLCALPDRGPAPINVNALAQGQEPLLVAAGFAPALARAAIAGRPPGGYRFITDFWSRATLDGMQPLGSLANATGLSTRWRAVAIDARAGGGAVRLTALIDARTGAVSAVEWR